MSPISSLVCRVAPFPAPVMAGVRFRWAVRARLYGHCVAVTVLDLRQSSCCRERVDSLITRIHELETAAGYGCELISGMEWRHELPGAGRVRERDYASPEQQH